MMPIDNQGEITTDPGLGYFLDPEWNLIVTGVVELNTDTVVSTSNILDVTISV